MTIEYNKIVAKDRDECADKCDYDKGEPCIICGKAVKETPNIKLLRLVKAGRYITDSEEDFEDDMGWYPVGNICYKRFLKMAK